MNTSRLETERLILRKFTEKDIESLYLILKDKEVNTFLPWFPLESLKEAQIFSRKDLRRFMQSHKAMPMRFV